MHLLSQRRLFERYGIARGLFDVRVLSAEKIRLHAAVFDAIKNGARRGIAVATGATGFLIVRLDTPGKVIMSDKSDIALVDAESEGVRRDHGFEGVGHEAILHVLSIGRG